MFGFIIGTLCLMALVGVVRRAWWHRHAWGMYACGSGPGHHGGYGGWHHHRWHHGWGGRSGGNPLDRNPFDRDPRDGGEHEGPRGHDRGGWSRAALFPLLRRLDLTPAQEKVVFQVAGDLRAKAAGLRESWLKHRKDVAAAVASPALDEARAREVFALFDPPIDALRDELAAGLRRIHEVLDDDQRRTLAEIVEALGPRAFWY